TGRGILLAEKERRRAGSGFVRASSSIGRTCSKCQKRNSLVYLLLLLPNIPDARDLSISSGRILLPVCLRNTSSRVGLDTPIEDNLISALSNARTMPGTQHPPFLPSTT